MCLTGEDGSEIYLNNLLDTSRTLEVVLHEITHAINWVYDVDDGTEEENIAEKHGLGWSQFWLANPRFEAWLVHTLKSIRKERRKHDGEEAKAT